MRHKAYILRLIFLFYKSFSTISLTENGFFDLTGGVSRNVSQDDLLRPLVAGKLVAELLEFFYSAVAAGFDLDDGACDLAQSLIGKSDYCDVLYLRIFLEEVLDLDRVDVLTAGYDNVLLTVYEEVEAVFILTCHITCEEPSVSQGLLGRFRISVVFEHDAGALDAELADLALRYGVAFFVNDLALPTVAGNADGAYFICVFESQVNAAWTGGFGKAVVRVVLVIREIIFPVTDQ